MNPTCIQCAPRLPFFFLIHKVHKFLLWGEDYLNFTTNLTKKLYKNAYMFSDWTLPACFTLFLDRGPTSLWWSLYNQGTGEGHELLHAATKTQQSLLEGYTQVQHTKQMFCLVMENHTWSAERSRRRWARRPLWGDWLWWLLCGWCWDCRASWL